MAKFSNIRVYETLFRLWAVWVKGLSNSILINNLSVLITDRMNKVLFRINKFLSGVWT
jgi:hypothetical protein